MAEETFTSLFDTFLARSPMNQSPRSPTSQLSNAETTNFVMCTLWLKDKESVKLRLIDAHAQKPMILPMILEHALVQNWLDELVYIPSGFALDLAALAHAEGHLDIQEWARTMAERSPEMTRSILQFLMIKANLEQAHQASMKQYMEAAEMHPQEQMARPEMQTTALQVRTVAALIQILEESLPKTSLQDLIICQRMCITAYPRLINLGEGVDDIIDANSRLYGNALPAAANAKMEDHYKKMYSDDMEVKTVVEILDRYKHSRDALEQDTFACMIHGLFDEYAHYVDYPLEALATTAVLFGGIISHKVISDLPLQIGLGMVLESVRDHRPDESMYKFGLQALMQLFSRFREWPGFCKQLLQIPGLRGTEAWNKAEAVVAEHEREHENEEGRHGGGSVGLGSERLISNGEDTLGSEQHPPPFASLNVDAPPAGAILEDPDADVQGKIQFNLNNLTETTLQAMFRELRELMDERYQQWFASHMVEERAKMQPNYHRVYLELVRQFEDRELWAEVLRETYVSVRRMLNNSEATMASTNERTYLKNLGCWLGLLTLARDKPIKQKNIAFKQLLMEAHDTKRLPLVIPFVCKVLVQGSTSNVFRPPNPWLMDIIHLLIELYHNAEIKLNLKFEIEVLCKGLSLDHKAIEPSGEILNRAPAEDMTELLGPETLETFDGLSLAGLPSASSHAVEPTIPDLGPCLSVPTTEAVNSARLHEMVRTAVTRALRDIIQPVVERSVTIAALSTKEMIHKDFATEPDENRLRTAAINMVKSTAGSLALVTSKEPLRVNFTNCLRNLAADLPQGLPEGIIIMCVNSNLELASAVIEKSAEERAVPEIEDMLASEFENRRQHRLQRPSEPYMDSGLSRWTMTIPHPYKMNPSLSGLNPEQMAIYDDFTRQARIVAASTTSHVASASDARTLANEVLQEQHNTVPNIATSAATPSLPHINTQLQHYSQGHGQAAGRQPAPTQMDARAVAERVNKLLEQLSTVATGAQEEHFSDLPRPHSVLDIVDALMQTIIKTQQTSEDFSAYAANQISQMLFRKPEGTLLLESLVHVLRTIRTIAGPATRQQIRTLFHQHPGKHLLHLPLIEALLGTDLLDWRSIDIAMADALRERNPGSIEFLDRLMDLALFNNSPLALFTDFVKSLEAAWRWIEEQPGVPGGQRFKSKVLAPPPALPANLSADDLLAIKQEQMDYVFDEWVHLCDNPNASDKAQAIYVQQLQSRAVIGNKDDFFLFIRTMVDKAVDQHHGSQGRAGLSEGYQSIDALVRMIGIMALAQADEAAFLDAVVAFAGLLLNHHHVKRGDRFDQRLFFRFFSNLLHEAVALCEDVAESGRERILLSLARRLHGLGPGLFPGFIFAWIALLSHHSFLPLILQLRDDVGWAPFTSLMQQLLSYTAELLKPFEVSAMAKEVYQAVLKMLLVLSHDFPEYMAANHIALCASLPPHATQLHNMILSANPNRTSPDPLQPGLKVDRIPDQHKAPRSAYDPTLVLQRLGLVDILDRTLRTGPSEDTVAQITYAINSPDGDCSVFGFVPVHVNRAAIDAVVTCIGNFAVARAESKANSPLFVPGAPDARTLHMIVAELGPEARYFFLVSMINHLRYANACTHYFSQAVCDMFGLDLDDSEQTEIRQQIVRILLERLIGYWPQPWGLIVTTIELVKNDKYHFFNLSFVKAAPYVRQVIEDKIIRSNAYQQ